MITHFFKGFILNASLTAKKKIQADSIAKSIYYDKVVLCRQLAVEYSKATTFRAKVKDGTGTKKQMRLKRSWQID